MKTIFTILINVILCSALFAGDGEMSKSEMINRGKYLVNLGGCNDCHTPKKMTDHGPVPDMARELSGHPSDEKLPPIDQKNAAPWLLFNHGITAAVGPWGISFSANLTPDDATGIGLWKKEHFIKAMQTGKHMGAGRPILPPMPWQNMVHVSEEDLSAMFAYLKSIKPIKNQVPAPVAPDELKAENSMK